VRLAGDGRELEMGRADKRPERLEAGDHHVVARSLQSGPERHARLHVTAGAQREHGDPEMLGR
jgi:hypothetical protein